MENKNYKAHLALLGANLIYGANFLIAKGLMPNYFKPSGLVLLRVLAAGMLFWIVKQFIKEKIEKKDLLLLAFCGLFGISINMLFFFHGLSLTSPIDASIIMTTTPVIVLILSALLARSLTNDFKAIELLSNKRKEKRDQRRFKEGSEDEVGLASGKPKNIKSEDVAWKKL